MVKRYLKLLQCAIMLIAGAVVLAAALYSAIFLWFSRVNTVVGVFSSVSYKFYGQAQGLNKIPKLIGEIASANQLEPKGDARGDSANWHRPTGVFNSGNLDLHISIEPYPLTENVSPDRIFHVTVYSLDSGRSDEWQKVSKIIEAALMPLAKVEEVVVQFDSAVYGTCTSEQRPEVADTVCSFNVTAPVDFNALNEKIKSLKKNSEKIP